MQVTLAIFAALSGLALSSPLPGADSVSSVNLNVARGLFCSQTCCSGPQTSGACDCNVFGCNCTWATGAFTRLGSKVNSTSFPHADSRLARSTTCTNAIGDSNADSVHL
ncbi:uncharacterized protein F5Z01DRAFT_634141 [Emericellopsis atlantica]|uniref:Uncharacterized protein n=1 Tax=Emericellopsis atlantica TaxID=2614577 RepID=A0A9P8CR21_9HYPO|nr:uncharacterized protein F5Z01DRAFT_634141 [Emericellopsis atlantica]KAG9256559.1 hypothetical protein F5Z01DRAFT_634141 [Emericellopsis atlantica]